MNKDFKQNYYFVYPNKSIIHKVAHNDLKGQMLTVVRVVKYFSIDNQQFRQQGKLLEF